MWTAFFETAAGASAALAGLVFVALSVNITRILQYPHLPARAAATVGALMLILVTSIAALIPQPGTALGAEIAAFGACGWILKVWSGRQSIRSQAISKRPRHEAVTEILLGQLQVLPFVAGGILLVLGRSTGLYWVAGGCIAVFVFSVLNGWVLLVEILR